MEITSGKIADYLDCPHKYHLMWVEGGRGRPSAPLAFDRSIHRALAQHYRAGGPGEQPLAHLLAELAHAWQGPDYLDTRQEQEYRAAAERALARFHESERGRASQVLAVSEKLIMPFDVPGDAQGGDSLAAIADRVDRAADGAVEVVDYRTGRHFPPEDHGTELLVGALQLLAKQRWREDRVRVILHGIRSGERVDVTQPDDQLEATRDRLRAVAAEIEAASVFPPQTGKACRWCRVKRWCQGRQED